MKSWLANTSAVAVRLGIRLLEAVYRMLPKSSTAFTAGAGIHFLKLANSYQQSIALGTAHRLGVFELLAKKPSTAPELASALSLDPKCAQILLDLLKEMKFLSARSEIYSNTYLASTELVVGGSSYMGGMLDVVMDQWRYWSELPETVKSGEGHPKLAVYSEENTVYPSYVRACCETLNHPSELLMRKLDVSGVKRALAGTVGATFIRALKCVNPSVEVTFACLPHFIQELPGLMKWYGMDFPVEKVETTPDPESSRWGENEEYDLIFFARKFAFVEDEHGVEYLRKAYQVMRPGGMVVLWEPVAENFRGFNWMRNSIALQDAIMGQGQPLYSRQEIRNFVEAAGFVKVRTINVLYGVMSYTVGVR
jgi:hypothetical protein